MDIEKYTNSKVYHFFEILFKLIVWNILTIILVCLAVAGPFLGFYYLKEGTLAGLLMILVHYSEFLFSYLAIVRFFLVLNFIKKKRNRRLFLSILINCGIILRVCIKLN